MKYDWERVRALLHISDLARHWPNLKHIHDSAMNELLDMQDQVKPKPEPKGPPTVEAEPEPKFERPVPRRSFSEEE